MSPKPRVIALLLWPLLLTVPGATPVEAAPSAATFVTLKWTAPGDDGVTGLATRYDLRYSTTTLTAANFNAARAASGLPAPHAAGSQETFTLSGLASDSTYFIALKTVDEAGNWSAISNVFVRTSQLVGVDGTPAELAFTEPWPNPARGSLRLSLSLPRAAETQIRVYDVAARRVRSLDPGWHESGEMPVTWDLRDDQGRRVSPGAYFIETTALGRQWTRRVVVID